MNVWVRQGGVWVQGSKRLRVSGSFVQMPNTQVMPVTPTTPIESLIKSSTDTPRCGLTESVNRVTTSNFATLVGACPVNPGGSGSSAQQTVVTKFGPSVTGKKVAVRQFAESFTSIAPHTTGVNIVHYSWKPTSISAITDSAVASATQNLLAGDVVEVWHEVDKKVRDGVFTMNEGVARKNAFYDAVKRVRPDLLVANTLTGWELDPKNPSTGGNIDKWAVVRADVLGVDLDGINTWPYPNYQNEVPVATSFVSRFEPYQYWSIPEYGHPYRAEDPNAVTLESWSDANMAYYRQQKCLYVMWFDFSLTHDYILDTTNELRMWREQVAMNPS